MSATDETNVEKLQEIGPLGSGVFIDPATGNIKLDDEAIVSVPLDAIKRYEAAGQGRIISPNDLDALYPTHKAKRQKQMPTVEMTYGQAKDIYHVLEILGGIVGQDQLPSTPIRQLSPLVITEKIADHWTNTLLISRQNPTLTGIHSFELHDELKRLLTHVLDECRTDAQDTNIPRRRKTDIALEADQVIDRVKPIRTVEDQQVFAEISNATDFDFKIAKAATNALAALVAQHSNSIDLSGFSEMYRRGLLPLSIIIENDEVLNAISKIVGRSKEQICESISRVEESHYELRAESIETLLAAYTLRVEQAHERSASKMHRNDGVPRRQPSTFKAANITHAKSGPSDQDITEAELKIKTAIERFAKLVVDASVTGELIDKHVFESEPDLPSVDSIVNQAQPNDLRVTISTTNFWFKAAQVSRQRYVPIGPVSNMAKAFEAIPVDSRATHVLAYLMKARLADTFVEGIIANSTGRFLLDQSARDVQFIAAAKQLDALCESLGGFHLNTIAGFSDPTKLKKDGVDTEKQWRKLVHNPILYVDRSDEFGRIDLFDPSLFDDGTFEKTFLLYHLPVPLTQPLFENTFGGIAWDLSNEVFGQRLEDIAEVDANGSLVEQALSWKAHYGTSSLGISTRDISVGLNFKEPEKLQDLFRPITQRYDVAFEGR